MKPPQNTSDSKQITAFFEGSIDNQLGEFFKILDTFDHDEFFNSWFEFVRGIDEIINIPLEFESKAEANLFLNLNLNFSNPNNEKLFKKILRRLKQKFGVGVAQRFKNIVLMSKQINHTRANMNLVDIQSTISYYQSRRIYYIAILHLIPHINNNTEIGGDFVSIHHIPNMLKKSGKISDQSTIDLIKLVPVVNTVEYNLANITTAFFYLLFNEALDDFEINLYGSSVIGNFNLTHLESFFLEPQRLSLLDQLELRKEEVETLDLPGIEDNQNQIFAFLEVENTLRIFQGAFKIYDIKETQIFQEVEYFVQEIKKYCVDEYKILIHAKEFERIQQKTPQLKPNLILSDGDYFEAIKTCAPFQRIQEIYVSNVVLMVRFVYQTLMNLLIKNRRFQIRSGFVFEDKASQVLEKYGFQLTREHSVIYMTVFTANTFVREPANSGR